MRIVFLYMKNIDNGSGSEFGKIQYNSNAKSWVLTLSQMLQWIMTPDTAGNSHAHMHIHTLQLPYSTSSIVSFKTIHW